MDRGSTSAFQTEIVKDQNLPFHLVEVYFDDQTVYLTDSYKTITYAGNDYSGVGHFLGFSDIEESTEVVVSNVTLSLSGIDQVWISNALNQDYIDRTIKIRLAFLDASQTLVIDPVLIFEGRMNQPSISEDPDGGKSTVSVSATNAWVDFSRKTGRHTNHEEQQIHFPGDKGFEFASEIVKDVIWGRVD
jgi:hypothetical protein